MIDEESFALQAGVEAAARVLASAPLSEVQRQAVIEATQVGIRTALSVYSKHVPVTMQQTGQIMTAAEREALQLLYKAAAILNAATVKGA